MNAEFADLLVWFIPLCTAVAGIIIAIVKVRAANTTADEAAESGRWKRLVDWNQRLQDEVEDCHRERDEARAEVLKWKAVAEGVGTNRQDEATALAIVRLAE